MIRNIEDLAELLGAEANEESMSRRVYKATDCGAWLVIDKDRGGIVVGSIVEGVEQCTENHGLKFPFEAEAFWTALQDVEDEAGEIWNATHGCEHCGPEIDGYTAIDPKCPHCGGAGIVM